MSKSSSRAIGILVANGNGWKLRVGRRVLEVFEVPSGFVGGDKVEAVWNPDNGRWEFLKGDQNGNWFGDR